MKQTLGTALAVCLLLAAANGLAAVFPSDSTTGGIALQEGFGARALGMGEAFTAVADDATCLYWNTAGLIRNPGIHLNASHVNGFDNSTYEQLIYTQNLGNIGLGAGASWLRGGLMSVDHPDGSESTVQSESDFVGILGLGLRIQDNLYFGCNAKLLNSTLAETSSASAILTDMGILLDLPGGYTAGFSLQNFGSSPKYETMADPVPVTARIGISYHLQFVPGITGLFAGDMVKTSDQDFAFNMGAEYGFAKMFFLRLGYKLGYDLEGSTMGLGMRWDTFELDYAVSALVTFSPIQKLSLDFRW